MKDYNKEIIDAIEVGYKNWDVEDGCHERDCGCVTIHIQNAVLPIVKTMLLSLHERTCNMCQCCDSCKEICEIRGEITGEVTSE